MSPLTWVIIVVVALLVLVAVFAVIRNRQRSGDVFASQPASRNGGTQ